MADKELQLVDAREANNVQRAVYTWIRSETERKFRYEYNVEDLGMCITAIQSPQKTRRYILGGYEAQYQFIVINRLYASCDDERLTADEDMNILAAWLEENTDSLILPDGLHFKKLRRDTGAIMSARYENGVEDHSVQFTLFYEVT